MPILPDVPPAEISAIARAHLEAVVAIESSSDESSTTVPSTEGQRALSQHLERFFSGLGAEVGVDEHANVIARLAGRGELAGAPPLALMIHLDTARGTVALPRLETTPDWDGSAVPYAGNPNLQVSVANYPSTAEFRGHTLVHGDGQAPFGLDDKLGLTHMMTLARLLADHPEIPHRPLLLIGRPDEEIGREEALIGLAEWLAAEGVDSGYTVDGIAPFEVNVENFNGMGAQILFASRKLPEAEGEILELALCGVNTHGATAKAEGHRSALRFAAELMASLDGPGVVPLRFESDPIRDCDGRFAVAVAGAQSRAFVDQALVRIVGPHVPRGASWSVEPGDDPRGDAAVGEMLDFVNRFIASRTSVPLLAEESEGYEGYTQPYRARVDSEGGLRLDVRIRDFDPTALEARAEHLRAVAGELEVTTIHHYDNMGPKLAGRRDLLTAALEAAEKIGVEARELPIRGGTGVDPFLDRGVFVANLGTGYFAPESEKEFTSMELLARHALWLVALVQS